MADIVVTAASFGPAEPGQPSTIIHSYTLAADATAGQAVYQNTSGNVVLSNAGASGTAVFLGLALQTKKSGQTVDVIEEGPVEGFTLDAMAYGAPAYLSDTAGALGTAAGTTSVLAGRVQAVNDFSRSKLLYIKRNP